MYILTNNIIYNWHNTVTWILLSNTKYIKEYKNDTL